MAKRSRTIKFNEKRNHNVARITVGWAEDGKQIRKAFYGHSEEEVQEKLDDYKKSTKDLLPGSEKALYNPTAKIKFRADSHSKKAKALSRIEQADSQNICRTTTTAWVSCSCSTWPQACGLVRCLPFAGAISALRRAWYASDAPWSASGAKGGYIDQESVTKTPSSIRDVPIPAPILEMLKKRSKDDDSLVFPDSKTGNYIFNKRPLRYIQKLCGELGLPVITFHDLRHTCCTRLFEAGVPLKTVQHLMGHSDIAITAAVYTHVMKEVATDTVKKLDELFEE